MLFQKNDYRSIEIIKSADDSMMMASRSIIKKLRQGYAFRGFQADLVRNKLDSCPYPEVICGDFNDVPNSYTYFHIKGDRQDVFVKKGKASAAVLRRYRLPCALTIFWPIKNSMFYNITASWRPGLITIRW